MESEHAFKYGEIFFESGAKFDLAEVNYQIVPYGYLVQDLNDPLRLFMFETYKDMVDYFTDHNTKG